MQLVQLIKIISGASYSALTSVLALERAPVNCVKNVLSHDFP